MNHRKSQTTTRLYLATKTYNQHPPYSTSSLVHDTTLCHHGTLGLRFKSDRLSRRALAKRDPSSSPRPKKTAQGQRALLGKNAPSDFQLVESVFFVTREVYPTAASPQVRVWGAKNHSVYAEELAVFVEKWPIDGRRGAGAGRGRAGGVDSCCMGLILDHRPPYSYGGGVIMQGIGLWVCWLH